MSVLVPAAAVLAQNVKQFFSKSINEYSSVVYYFRQVVRLLFYVFYLILCIILSAYCIVILCVGHA